MPQVSRLLRSCLFVVPNPVDFDDTSSLEDGFHAGHIVERFPIVELRLDFRFLRHARFGVADCGFNVSRRDRDDAISIADHRIARIDRHTTDGDRNVDGAGPAFAGIRY
jgi:hypothetical protein